MTQFLSTFRSTYLSNTVEQTVWGWILLYNQTVAASSFPIDDAGYFWGTYSGEIYDVLPASLYATVQVQAPAVSLNWGPVNMASLRGERLGLVFESGFAKLKLDDTEVVAAATAVGTGTPVNLTVSIDHAESEFVAPGVQVNETATLGSKGDGAYALIYGFDVTSEYLKARQEQLDRYRELNYADTDWRVRLETMNVIGLNWLLQTELSHQLVAALKDQSPAYLHRFGRVAHELATGSNWSLYIDVPMNFSGFVSRTADPGDVKRLAAETADSFIASAMEHGVIEQTQPATLDTVVSTTKVLQLANAAGTPIYLATDTATWNAVKTQLIGYSGPETDPATELGQMKEAIDDGAGGGTNHAEVLVPRQAVTSGVWNGRGFAYSTINATEFRQGMIIGGLYSGGFSVGAGTRAAVGGISRVGTTAARGGITRVGTIATPHGLAIQATSSEAMTALSQVQGGAQVFRQGSFGI